MKTTAIIASAGSGARMNISVPKQYIEIGGIPILVHTLRKFEESISVNEIILVVPEQDEDFVKNRIIDQYGIRKVKHIVPGGDRRQDSVSKGLEKVNEETDIVIIHDGVRPFITTDKIEEIIKETRRYDAVILGIPIVDTIKRIDKDMYIIKTLENSLLWRAQTPQAFKRNVILYAYKRACKNNIEGTDDASLVEHAGFKVKIITGTSENIKITTPEDLNTAEHFLAASKS